jgi:hypothetical protein
MALGSGARPDTHFRAVAVPHMDMIVRLVWVVQDDDQQQRMSCLDSWLTKASSA